MDDCLPTDAAAALIVTAALDVHSAAVFTDLRDAYFPAERNHLDAHVTLFHALPSGQLAPHLGALAQVVAAHKPQQAQQAAAGLGPQAAAGREVQGEEPTGRGFGFRAPFPYKLGQGVALCIECPPLAALRKRLQHDLLAAVPAVHLTGQDRNKGRLHVTVQNKVTREDAAKSFQAISGAWNPEFGGRVLGLTLWHYQGGPWQPLLSWPL